MFKKILLCAGLTVYMLISVVLAIALFAFPKLRFRLTSQWTRQLNRFLLRALSIHVAIEGDLALLKKRGSLIVSNHLGYLDGFVLGSIFPLVYTSKAQVKSWPVFGWVTMAGGTIFIDRQKKSKVSQYIIATAAMLMRNVNVLVFPEGTSTNGDELRAFQSIHFQAPVVSSSPVLPVTITYSRINEEGLSVRNRDALCWYGQVQFFCHLMGVLRLKRIEAKVMLHPMIEMPGASANGNARKEVSLSLHGLIAKSYPLFPR